jgi:nitroreductase
MNHQAFAEIVNARKSVRGFLPDAVDQAVLDDVFNLAQRAPSNCNTQPWQVHVLGGAKAQQLKDGFVKAMFEGQFSMDFPYDGKYQGVYKERQYDAANVLYSAQAIAREDKDKRNEAFFRNFSFFDAPHAAFLFMPEEFGLREAADVGMYAQNLMLALTAYGLASCPQTALGFHCDLVREVLGIDASQKLLFGISFGFEDTSHPANKAKTGRATLADAVTFHG